MATRFHRRLFLVVVGLISCTAFAQEPSDAAGKWQWSGTAGWQRVALDLRVDGTRLSGTIAFGPGTDQARSPDEFWEYFFKPVIFDIANGRVQGAAIAFEHTVNGNEKLSYSGRIDGDRMTLTREFAAAAKDPWTLGYHKIEFTLERMR